MLRSGKGQTMKVTIEGEPKGKGRPRFYNGHAVTPQTTRDYEEEAALAYKAKVKKTYHGAVGVRIRAYFKIPKGVSKAVRQMMEDGVRRPTKKPDIDNIDKIILDALNGIAFDDDKQVVEETLSKFYSVHPRVEVEVYEI